MGDLFLDDAEGAVFVDHVAAAGAGVVVVRGDIVFIMRERIIIITTTSLFIVCVCVGIRVRIRRV